MSERSAEEFFGLCVSNARVLDSAARRMADSGDAKGALATAWGSDVFAAQGVLWERILGAAAATRRQMYRAADALFAGLRAEALGSEQACSTCADVIELARARLLAECDVTLQAAISGAWTDIAYLGVLPAPALEDLQAAAAVRLEGMSPESFVLARRRAAEQAMADAQALRVRGDASGALQIAYDADFLAFEAYLVESAVAAGDSVLQTVTVRWELASAAIAALPGLPEAFVAGVEHIRIALCSGLADADASRLIASLPALR